MHTQIIKGNYDFNGKAKRRKTRKRWKRTNIRFFASFIFIHLIFCYHFFPAAKHQQSRNWDQTTTFKTKQMRLASSFYWNFRNFWENELTVLFLLVIKCCSFLNFLWSGFVSGVLCFLLMILTCLLVESWSFCL